MQSRKALGGVPFDDFEASVVRSQSERRSIEEVVLEHRRMCGSLMQPIEKSTSLYLQHDIHDACALNIIQLRAAVYCRRPAKLRIPC